MTNWTQLFWMRPLSSQFAPQGEVTSWSAKCFLTSVWLPVGKELMSAFGTGLEGDVVGQPRLHPVKLLKVPVMRVWKVCVTAGILGGAVVVVKQTSYCRLEIHVFWLDVCQSHQCCCFFVFFLLRFKLNAVHLDGNSLLLYIIYACHKSLVVQVKEYLFTWRNSLIEWLIETHTKSSEWMFIHYQTSVSLTQWKPWK